MKLSPLITCLLAIAAVMPGSGAAQTPAPEAATQIAGPVLMGAAGFSPLRFMLLNALGAMLWASLLASIGWVFGEASKAVLGELRHIEGWLLLGVVMLGLLAWAGRLALHRRRGR